MGTPNVELPPPVRDPAPMLAQTLREWGGGQDLWLFGYASLIWRPEFDAAEQRLARVHGYHRALRMWSRVNRGTPACPGLVFALLSGGSCTGMAFRVPQAQGEEVLRQLWPREMVTGVYDPRWLQCRTDGGPVRALAFTLPRNSPNYTGPLSAAQYRDIFAQAVGRYGSTLDYAQRTLSQLEALGIPDRTLARLLRQAQP
jgi:glutathione-specific gamma-glutamylcyclotransferase